MPDRFDVGPADRDVVQLQHLPRGVVDQLQPPLRIDDDDAFDHAGEDRFHARAIARLLGELAADFLDRLVERPRDRAELVVAEVEARRRQVAAADSGRATSAISRTRWPMRAEKIQAMAARADQREAERRQRRA